MKKINWLLIISALFVGFNSCKKDSSSISTETKEGFIIPKKEMRAVWMATVYGLDWPQDEFDVDAQKQQYVNYLNKFKELNINAVFVQVKGMGDAFYNSPYEPWSAAITGTRGKDPGYDVFKFMVDEAHARNIEFHAWLNPYRIATRASSATPYPELHPSVNPDWVVSHEKIQIYNPAVPEVRQRLADIVKDIITKYNVDGIHFDDYFYPDPSTAGIMVDDKPDFVKYGAGSTSIENFRRDNVNKAIKAVYDVIVATKPGVVFSISPAASDTYNYNTMFANVQKWSQEGWVDVVIPQLYQPIGSATSDFKERLNWWHQFRYQSAMMVGYGYYRFGDPTAPAGFQSVSELENEFALTKKYRGVVGHVLYSAKYITLNNIGITDKLAELWNTPSVMPFLGRSTVENPVEPQNVHIENGILKWAVSGNLKSVVYYTSDMAKESHVLIITTNSQAEAAAPGYYSVTTLNTDNKESSPSEPVQEK